MDTDEIDGRTFMNEAAEAMASWAPIASSYLSTLAAKWVGHMPLRIGVAVVRGHAAPNYSRLPAKLRQLGAPFDETMIVGRSPKETLTLMLAAKLP